MVDGRKLIAAVVGALIIAGMVRADMMPVSRPHSPNGHALCVSTQANLQPILLSGMTNYLGPTDLYVGRAEFLTEAQGDVKQTMYTQHSLNLTDAPSSFSLCLYALMGLALCRSAPWIKKLSFGHIPEWYHDGGPFQIGHSLAVSPESLCPVPVCCFIQPVRTVEFLIPQYRLRAVVSLWRKSQFTPDVIASRGPPCK